jgi:hypothetical protein
LADVLLVAKLFKKDAFVGRMLIDKDYTFMGFADDIRIMNLADDA